MATKPRGEAEILAELESLTRTPGYAHVVAHLCNRDNLVIYQGQIKPDDMAKLYGHDRLIRTEFNTLLGLMVKGPLDLTQPTPYEVLKLAEHTDRLMLELHRALDAPAMERLLQLMREVGKGDAPKPEREMWQGDTMREPIFYGSESAYSFQYCDLVVEKYSADDPWLVANKGFNITQAKNVAHALCQLMDEKGAKLSADHKREGKLRSTWLPCFEHTVGEVAFRSRVPEAMTKAVLDAFTLRGTNETFKALGDFNAVSAFPVFATDRGTVLMFQHYNILEALYESPYFWMGATNPDAAKHRGEFVEKFATRRLAGVFGPQHVHRGVQVVRNRKEKSAEIDVLVIFGDRLIIVQAKAKKLTLEARKGNDGQLRKDFQQAIQDSYDQAWDCASKIVDGFRLEDGEGRDIPLPYSPKEIYLVCLVSDHYPALAFQAKQFLKYQTTDVIKPPFVMDVFLLDALTEMLASPLRLLSYMALRVSVTEQVVMSHEFNALGFHLKRNLWLEENVDMMVLDDAVSVDLDTAMMVRRENVPGDRTPSGILTKLQGTLYERLIKQIEDSAAPASLALGFQLLTLSEGGCFAVHNAIKKLTGLVRGDGDSHDFTLALENGGLCLHCNVDSTAAARLVLGNHCEMRKYREKAPQWFGISFDTDANLQFGVALEYPWKQSDEMDEATRDMLPPQPIKPFFAPNQQGRKQKIGRNEQCPCGSGKKYKHCHGR